MIRELTPTCINYMNREACQRNGDNLGPLYLLDRNDSSQIMPYIARYLRALLRYNVIPDRYLRTDTPTTRQPLYASK